jgi:translation initiation factor IF-3
MFRGREMAHPELGLRILERIADEVNEIAMVESAPRQDGRNMTMVLHPLKRDNRKSASAKAAAKAAAATPAPAASKPAPPPPSPNGPAAPAPSATAAAKEH